MEEIAEKWGRARREVDELEKKIEGYRRQMEEEMLRLQLDEYECEAYKIKKQVQQRAVMSKKLVPIEIWDKYAIPQRVEFITLMDKSKMKTKTNTKSKSNDKKK
jgi:hypothetical protein